MADVWNPEQYERFRRERAQPFHDLLGLVEPRPGLRVVDLGCGTGDLTALLHRTLAAARTVGVDSSSSMLASAPAEPGLSFVCEDIARFAPSTPVDLVFSNAALHWLPDHPALLRRLTSFLDAGGQLAVQVPMNDEHPSHEVAFEVARAPEFRAALQGFVRRPPLLEPERYAAWLHRLGYARQVVRLQVYGHLLESREQVVEWVRGALLTDYQKRLQPALWERFLRRYRELLLPQLADERPYLYTYPRLFLWAAR